MSGQKRFLLVLGASSDLGCALISRVIGNYDGVLAHYRTMNPALGELKESFGEKLSLFEADFLERKSVEKMTEEIKSSSKIPLHIVQFAASDFKYIAYERSDWSQFERELQVSLYSFYAVTRAFLPYMKKCGEGKIIATLSSVTGDVPPKFLPSYVTTKYALLGLVKSLAADYADRGIQVNGVSPEMIETKFLRDIPDYVKENNAEANPRKRNLTVDEVIPTYEWLLSKGADCVTGQNLFVTGGR